MLEIAVLGCGRIGRVHAANAEASRRMRLVAVHDPNEPATREVAGKLGCRVAASADEILGDEAVRAVVIATPTSTHADMIEAAAAAGKAIFCEKPIDLDVERVERCAEAVAGSGVPIQIGFNRRFDRGHRAVREAARAGEIGEIHQVVISSRDPLIPPRDHMRLAGGLFRDMTIHDFDLSRYMLGEEPVEVFAIAGALADPGLEADLGDHDTAMFLLRTASGKMCHINNSRSSVYGHDQRVELLGREGMLQSGNPRVDEVRRYGEGRTETASPYPYFFMDRYHAAFVAELEAFAEAVEDGRPPEVGFEDGRRALRLAEAAYRSLKERRMVHVDEIG